MNIDPNRWTTEADGVVALGRIKKIITNHLTEQEIWDNEEHDRQMRELREEMVKDKKSKG